MSTPIEQLRNIANTARHHADVQGFLHADEWRQVADELDRILDQLRAAPSAGWAPPTVDGITLTPEELDELTAWSRATSAGGFRVWVEHDTAVAAATRILARRLETAITAMAHQHRELELLPAESIALTTALAQVLRGEEPSPNVAAWCVLALARLVGRHDWTEPPEGDNGPKMFHADVTPEERQQ